MALRRDIPDHLSADQEMARQEMVFGSGLEANVPEQNQGRGERR